ncbi:hypothetical protein PG984_012048 [Apiospora sp. TS-2023a]
MAMSTVEAQQATAKASLPPQTTPFAATVKTCQHTSIWCPVYPSSGVACYAGGFSETAGTCHGLFYMDQCYPTEYSQIFSSVGTWSDDVTQAFPGRACPSAWITGCTTTLTLPPTAAAVDGTPNQTYYTQTWCCPRSYACWTGGWEASWTGGITPTRICTGQARMGGSPSGPGATAVASAIILWVPYQGSSFRAIAYTSTTAVTGTGIRGGPDVSVTDLSLLSSSSAAALPSVITVFHPVFPLQGQEPEDPGGGDPGGPQARCWHRRAACGFTCAGAGDTLPAASVAKETSNSRTKQYSK